jgi:ribosomal protein S18 acetylase RimI-like enzyme
MPITLRDETVEDQLFLLEVYASTRAQEMALVPWSDEQREAFVRSQFEAQHSYYQAQFPDASYQVIMVDGERAGRVYVLRESEAIRILDITLLPQHRNLGIGTSLIREILAEGDQAGKPVNIWVENFNPSLKLFERLGFVRVQEHGFNCLMEYRPPVTA